MALTILSGISEQDFIACIRQADVATLTRLPGVGKKTAERLIVEMKDKVEALDDAAAAKQAADDSPESLIKQALQQAVKR